MMENANPQPTPAGAVVDEAPVISAEGVQEGVGTAEPIASPEVSAQPTFDGRLKLKVDGEEMVLDLTDPDTLKRVTSELQIGSSARKRHERASVALKQLERFQKKLAEDPYSAVQELGIPAETFERALEENYLKRREYEALPEAEKKARKLEEENAAIRAALQKKEAEEQEKAQAQEFQRVQMQLEEALVNVVDGSDLPKDDPVVLEEHFRGIGRILQEAWEAGYPMRPDEALTHYKKEIRTATSRRVRSAKIEELLEDLGPQGVKALKAHFAKEAQSTPTAIPRDRNPTVGKGSDGPERRYKSPDEAREAAMKALGIG